MKNGERKKGIFARQKQTANCMKQHIYHFLHKAACLALLWVCLTPAMGHAQGGITVYSDTVSVLEDAADDSVRQSPAVVPGAHFFSVPRATSGWK